MGKNTPTLNVFPRRDTHHFYSQPTGWNQSHCSTPNSWRGRNTQPLLCPRRGGNCKYQWALVKSTSKYIVLFQFETRAIESSLNLKDLKIWDKSVIIQELACLAPCSMDMVSVKVQYLPHDTIQIELGVALCFFLHKPFWQQLFLSCFLIFTKERSWVTIFLSFPNPKFLLHRGRSLTTKTACREEKLFEPIFPCSLREFYPLSLKFKKMKIITLTLQYSLVITHQCIIHIAS